MNPKAPRDGHLFNVGDRIFFRKDSTGIPTADGLLTELIRKHGRGPFLVDGSEVSTVDGRLKLKFQGVLSADPGEDASASGEVNQQVWDFVYFSKT